MTFDSGRDIRKLDWIMECDEELGRYSVVYSLEDFGLDCYFFIFLWSRSPFTFILLCPRSEDSQQQNTIPDDSPSKDWQSKAGRLLDLSPGLQLNSLVSQSMSHQYSIFTDNFFLLIFSVA
jgi:hypothetical protein